MARIIKNPIEVKLIFEKNNGDWVLEPSVHYGVGATEYPEFNHRKGLPVELTPTQETQIKNFTRM